MFFKQLKAGDWIRQVPYSTALLLSKAKLEILYNDHLADFLEEDFNGSLDAAVAAEAGYYNLGFGTMKWEIDSVEEMVTGKYWLFLKAPIRLLTSNYDGPRVRLLPFLVSCPYCETMLTEEEQAGCQDGGCMQRFLEKVE